MTEACVPVTRFSAIDEADGCTKRTDEPLPIEKLPQLMTALSVVCLIVVCADDCVIVAEPAETVPPLGPAACTGTAHRQVKIARTRLRSNTLSVACVHSNKVEISSFNKEAHDQAKHTIHFGLCGFCLRNPPRNREAGTKPQCRGISCIYVLSFALFVVTTEIKVFKKTTQSFIALAD